METSVWINEASVSKKEFHQGRCISPTAYADTDLPRDVSVCYLGSLPFVVVASPGHPLSKEDQIDFDDLQQHRQILVKGFDGSALSHFPPVATSIWWTNTFFLLRDLARQGLGWSYVPLHLIEAGLEK